MEVRVFINGRKIPLNDFVSQIIGKTVLGMISSLKYIERPLKVTIELETDEIDYRLF